MTCTSVLTGSSIKEKYSILNVGLETGKLSILPERYRYFVFVQIPNFVYNLWFSLYVSSSIEKNGFKRGSVDYLFFTCICLGMIYTSAIILGISSLTGVYLYSLYYYFGRIHTERLIIINFIPVRAPYCLWFLLALEWLTGDPSLYNDLLGLLVGHCLFFISNIYQHLGMCREQDRKTFDTPQSL